MRKQGILNIPNKKWNKKYTTQKQQKKEKNYENLQN